MKNIIKYGLHVFINNINLTNCIRCALILTVYMHCLLSSQYIVDSAHIEFIKNKSILEDNKTIFSPFVI